MTFGRPSALLSQAGCLEEPLAYNLDDMANMADLDQLPKAPDGPSTTCLFVHTMYVSTIVLQ